MKRAQLVIANNWLGIIKASAANRFTRSSWLYKQPIKFVKYCISKWFNVIVDPIAASEYWLFSQLWSAKGIKSLLENMQCPWSPITISKRMDDIKKQTVTQVVNICVQKISDNCFRVFNAPSSYERLKLSFKNKNI